MRRLLVSRCFYCDKQLSRQKKTRDHLRPRSKGGSNQEYNVVDACRGCNGDKSSLLLDEYRQVVAFRLDKSPDTFKFPGELGQMDADAYQKQLKQQKNKRDQRKASGMCMRCGKVPARPNRVDCARCAEEANKPRSAKKKIGVCANCGDVLARSGFINCEDCAVNLQKYYHENKRQCFDHYGRICTCCKQEFDERFLTLGHDGAANREGIGSTLYQWAIKNQFPPTLQTHCFNCNMGKSVNNGVCPHQEPAPVDASVSTLG